jgi:hypothetical protein
MRLLVITLLTFFNFLNKATTHDAVSAKFHVVARGEVLFLEIEFEEENLVKLNKTKSLRVTKKEFETYINETTTWVFDNEKIAPKILSIQTEGHHKKAICFLSKKKENIKSIQVKNEFLLGIETHINIVMLDFNGTFKDFELDKNRREIIVSYD